ncbi:uncharacterized protein PV09_02939 [Verruconis gallopava]|uniref:ER-bound oxygenase mpaB/mpaB'/Rubber oxygenase catalytic domain-containing protein n=1 Tax=Verruconis gallopava TaxID=253628 RepID=A0A0D1XUV0_9PEZI|nr:uncharacterized protein PV09_02939 [Verruconis gallopava]KIW06506.1 hypothetical protein PV09_02939 [Verruconis gallopava]
MDVVGYFQSAPRLWIASLLVAYLIAVRVLRYQRINRLERKYAKYVEKPYSMDYRTAHEIAKLHMLDEQVFLSLLSTQWALIKTYSIARGTRLLVKTRQIGSLKCVGRRAEDTGVFLAELIAGDMDEIRWMEALSKVNWLHSRYKNQISKGEMLSTLAFFIIEPIKFINAYGWRPLTKMEEVSRFVFWKEIGLRMGMDNIPDTLEELVKWKEEYEQKEQKFSPDNVICTKNTMDLFLRNLPKPLHGFMLGFAQSLMEPRCRRALGWPDPPAWIEWLVHNGLWFRGVLIRHFFLPRFTSPPKLPEKDAEGRMYRTVYAFEPWYMKTDPWTRFKVWLGSGGRLHAGGEWGSKGFTYDEVGPPELAKASKKSTLAQAEAMMEYSRNGVSGCPFTNGGELVWAND